METVQLVPRLVPRRLSEGGSPGEGGRSCRYEVKRPDGVVGAPSGEKVGTTGTSGRVMLMVPVAG